MINDGELIPKSAVEEEELQLQSVEDSVFEMEAVASRYSVDRN